MESPQPPPAMRPLLFPRTLLAAVPLALLLAAALATPVAAQDADALAADFAAAWSTDDTDAVRQMLADDVLVVDDDLLLDGPDEVMDRWGATMAGTGRMTITPIRSGATSDAAYQVGRWTIDFEGGQAAGSHHFTFRAMPDGAYRLVAAHIRTDPAPVLPRAAEGEPVVLMINPVAADKREQFEAFVRDFWADIDWIVAEGHGRPGDREALAQTRVLFPARANEDGTYTYVFLADPVVEEADYAVIDLLRLRYDEEEAQRRYALFRESLAGPQEIVVLEQTDR